MKKKSEDKLKDVIELSDAKASEPAAPAKAKGEEKKTFEVHKTHLSKKEYTESLAEYFEGLSRDHDLGFLEGPEKEIEVVFGSKNVDFKLVEALDRCHKTVPSELLLSGLDCIEAHLMPKGLAMLLAADFLNKLLNLDIYKKLGFASVEYVEISVPGKEAITVKRGAGIKDLYEAVSSAMHRNPYRSQIKFRYGMGGKGAVNYGQTFRLPRKDSEGGVIEAGLQPKHYGMKSSYEFGERFEGKLMFISENKLRGCLFPTKSFYHDTNSNKNLKEVVKNVGIDVATLKGLISRGFFHLRGAVFPNQGWQKRGSVFLTNADQSEYCSLDMEMKTASSYKLGDDERSARSENSIFNVLSPSKPDVTYYGMGVIRMQDIMVTVTDSRVSPEVVLKSDKDTRLDSALRYISDREAAGKPCGSEEITSLLAGKKIVSDKREAA